jgi:hypothetical protein
MSVGGVEFRLGVDGGRAVDLAFCVDGEVGRAHLVEPPLDPRDDVAGVWTFLRGWAESGTLLHAHVPLVWLEFDHGPVEAGRPIPFLTFMLDDGVGIAAQALGPAGELRRLLQTGLLALLGGVDDAHLDAIVRAVRLLPTGGRLRHVAVMPHRGTRAIRGIVSLLRSEVAAYVGRLGWVGNSATLEDVVRRLAPLEHPVSIGFDVTNAVQPAIGIEFHWPTVPARDGRWTTLLDELVGLALCTGEQRRALAAWGSEDDDTRRLGTVHRHVLVKVTFGAAEAMAAKAYLTLTPRLRLP